MTNNTRAIQPGEGERKDGIRWFTKEDLFDPHFQVPPDVQYCANAALDELGS